MAMAAYFSRDSPADEGSTNPRTSVLIAVILCFGPMQVTSELIVPMRARAPTLEAKSTHLFKPGQTVDVLFVVDNSGSMSEEQSNLRESFTSFIAGADQFSNDFQIGLVTMDMQNDDDLDASKEAPYCATLPKCNE